MAEPLSFLGKFQRKGFFIAQIAMAAALTILSLCRLRAFPDPPGQNGYFYLKQTKFLAENLSFYFADHSLVFLPLFLLQKLTANELLSFQLAISLSLAFLYGSLCYLAEQCPLRPAEKFLFSLWVLIALFSSSFFAEFSLNFFKNLLAATLLLWCAGLLLGHRPRLAFGFFCLAFLTHKSTALVGGIFGLVFLFEQVALYLREKAEKAALLRAGAALLLLALFLTLFLLFFPNAIAFLDFAGHTFAPPGSRMLWWRKLFQLNHHRGAEVVAWLIIFVLLLARWREFPRPAKRLLASALLFFVVATHPFQASGEATLAYRLILLLPILIYPLALLALQAGPPRWRLSVLFTLCAISVPYFSPLAFSSRMLRLQIRPFSALREDVEKIPRFVKPTDYLISHHGLEFFVDYVTGIRSRSFLPEPGISGKQFRLAFVPPAWLKKGTTFDEINQVAILKVGHTYVLLEEADWGALAAEHEFPGSWRNPDRRKPAHVFAE